MSKDELQVNFRMPASLKRELEAAAKQSGRSLTAEVVARLELSLLAEGADSEELLPAELARDYSETARRSLPSVVRDRIRRSINKAVVMGLESTSVSFSDMGLESLQSDDLAQIHFQLSYELKAAGYFFEWDGGESIWISFRNESDALDGVETLSITVKADESEVTSAPRRIRRTKAG